MKIQNDIRPYRVLSLDGGGMRGLYTASVLRSLVRCFCQTDGDKDIGKAFDLIVGTSTGGILACGLVAGIPVSRMIEFYLKKGKKIFTHPFPHGKFKQFFWLLRNKYTSANSDVALAEELFNVFGDKTLNQVYDERHIGLGVTAVHLMDHYPRVFKTPHNLSNSVNDYKLVDICLATSAAPILFSIACLPDQEKQDVNTFVDGGLWANNPSLFAVMEALTCSKKNQSIEIVSIGTCPPPVGQVIAHQAHKQKGGLSQWRYGIDLMELTMDSQSKAHHFMADNLCSQFRALGKDIRLYRLKQSVPSIEQAKFLSLDQPSEKACSLLTELGKKDGEDIYKRESVNKNSVIQSIFTHLSIV